MTSITQNISDAFSNFDRVNLMENSVKLELDMSKQGIVGRTITRIANAIFSFVSSSYKADRATMLHRAVHLDATYMQEVKANLRHVEAPAPKPLPTQKEIDAEKVPDLVAKTTATEEAAKQEEVEPVKQESAAESSWPSKSTVLKTTLAVATIGAAGAGTYVYRDEIGSGLSQGWDATTQHLGNAWDATTQGLGNAWDATTQGLGNAWDATTQGLGNAWSHGVQQADALRTWTGETASSLGTQACDTLPIGCGEGNQLWSDRYASVKSSISDNAAWLGTKAQAGADEATRIYCDNIGWGCTQDDAQSALGSQNPANNNAESGTDTQ